MTNRITEMTEAQFRAWLGREIAALLAGRTFVQRTLDRLAEIRIGMAGLPAERLDSITGGIKLLLFSLRAECEVKTIHAKAQSGKGAKTGEPRKRETGKARNLSDQGERQKPKGGLRV